MIDQDVMAVMVQAADAVHEALATTASWGLLDGSGHQHHSDLAADAAAVGVLHAAGLGVLSEESGSEGAAREVIVVLDPLDGSTNAAQGLPWFAVSLCAVDGTGLRASLVRNLATGTEYRAIRGEGATRDGAPISPSDCRSLSDAIIALSDIPAAHYGWRQYRTLGAAALDLCAVADGSLDGYVDCGTDAHGVWDYLGAVLVCREAGAAVGEALGRDLLTLEHADRRTPMAAASTDLLDQLMQARNDS